MTILPPLKRGNGFLIADRDKAEALAQAFAAVHDGVSGLSSPHEDAVADCVSALGVVAAGETQAFSPVSLEEVDAAIRRLNSGKAPGFDGITPVMLKAASRKVRLQIYYIFRSSFSLSLFPDYWKTARVSPVPKPGKPRNSVDSY